MTHRKNYKHQKSQKAEQDNFIAWYFGIPEESEGEEEQEETLLHPGEKQGQQADQKSSEEEEEQDQSDILHIAEENIRIRRRKKLVILNKPR